MTGRLIYDDTKKRYAIIETIYKDYNDDVLILESRIVLEQGDSLTIRVNDKWVKKDIDDVFGWYLKGIGRAAALVAHRAIT